MATTDSIRSRRTDSELSVGRDQLAPLWGRRLGRRAGATRRPRREAFLVRRVNPGPSASTTARQRHRIPYCVSSRSDGNRVRFVISEVRGHTTTTNMAKRTVIIRARNGRRRMAAGRRARALRVGGRKQQRVVGEEGASKSVRLRRAGIAAEEARRLVSGFEDGAVRATVL